MVLLCGLLMSFVSPIIDCITICGAKCFTFVHFPTPGRGTAVYEDVDHQDNTSLQESDNRDLINLLCLLDTDINTLQRPQDAVQCPSLMLSTSFL